MTTSETLVHSVLLSTDVEPSLNMGGPGRFVPFLFDLLFKNRDRTNVSVNARIGDLLYQVPDEIVYPETLSFAYGGRSLDTRLRDLLYRSYYPVRVNKSLKRMRYKTEYSKLVRTHHINVINSHDFGTTYDFQSIDVPIVMTCHYKGSLYREFLQYNGRFKSAKWETYLVGVEKTAILRANALTFPSLSAQGLLVRDFPELEETIRRKSVVIHTGSEPISTLEGNTYEAVRYVLNIANHIPDKGIDIALRFFHDAFSTNTDFVFINVGNYGPDTESLQRLVGKLGLEGRVRFLGLKPRAEVHRLMRGATALLHTPRNVVFDLVVLEAMGTKTPVIATNCLGNVEALGANHPLFLDLQDEQRLDARAVYDFIRDEVRVKEVREQQYQRLIQDFSLSKMLSGYIDVYRSLNQE